jgi:EF-P beta-lysylation protein EpmB
MKAEETNSNTVVRLSEVDWKQTLRNALRSAQDLADAGLIDPAQIPQFDRVLARYPLILTLYYADLIDRSDPACPIRLQAIPQLRELVDEPGFYGDPLRDLQNRPAPRITHRYGHRALLHLTPNCSMNCRYCFRKSLLGENRAEFFDGELAAAHEYIAITPEIQEVIFSGGDPFLANEKTLEQSLGLLRRVSHLRRVRFHTRVPVTLPSRVTSEFVRMIGLHGLPSIVVVHFNHPKELSFEAREALSILKAAGHTLLNQSVLLAGVNDNAITLQRLSEGLFESGVLPYYLHHPDRAQGTKHFDVSIERGLEIHTELRRQLPGYLVPRYVLDDSHTPYKLDVCLTDKA